VVWDIPWGMGTTLLVLAAGMGSRYGGLKQLDHVGPGGETLLDYSIFDALRAGFGKVVFVIRKSIEAEFREAVISRYEGVVEVGVAFQEPSDLPEGFSVSGDREKPWGTGHAVWAARKEVREPFLVVNADDFYGREAYAIMGAHLRGEGSGMAMVAYQLENTLSENGEVSRGVCRLDAGGGLESVEEHTHIARSEGGVICGCDEGGAVRELGPGMLVSMNFWGFPTDVFAGLEERMSVFLRAGGERDAKAEFYLPTAISDLVGEGRSRVSVYASRDKWFGVTYRPDRELVASALAEKVAGGEYPAPVWGGAK